MTGLKLGGRTSRGAHEWNVKHGAEFDVVTLAAGEDRMVLVIQEERKLGKIVHVKPGDDQNGPVNVTLEPLATIAGRVTGRRWQSGFGGHDPDRSPAQR